MGSERARRSERLDPVRVVEAAELLKAMGHPLRLRLLSELRQTQLHVSALAERLGVGQAVVSQQLRILRLHRLVEPVRAKRFVSYRLLEPTLRELLSCLSSLSKGTQ